MLMPVHRLWQGLQQTRGPSESAATSGRDAGITHFGTARQGNSSSGAAVGQLHQPHRASFPHGPPSRARLQRRSRRASGPGSNLPPPSSSATPPQRAANTAPQPIAVALSNVATTPGQPTPFDGEGSSFRSSSRRVVVTYDEESSAAEPSYRAVEAAVGGKPLKINVDLLLWRCRLKRINARRTTDAVKREASLKEAEAGLRRCLYLDRTDPRPYVVLGKLLLQRRQFDAARALYTDGLTFCGNANPYIWSALGWLEYQCSNFDRAKNCYDAALVVDKTHACAWHKWGTMEKARGNYPRARDLWMSGIQSCTSKPQSSNAYLFNALAVMAADLGRVQEARAWFEEGTRTVEGMGSVALWQAWAMLEARKGDPGAVRYLFKKALQANPKSRYTHLAWGLWERKLGNLRQCVQLLQRGHQLNPTDAALLQAWAIVMKQVGRPDIARDRFEAGTRADPSHVPLWQAWGVMEFEQGNLDRARELFQQGVWENPGSRDTVYVFHAWARLERSVGEFGLAQQLFRAAIKIDPKNDIVWNTWIDMEQDRGNLVLANDLTLRRTEQQWEFEVPANFTTRPGDPPLVKLVKLLSDFFQERSASVRSGRGGRSRSKPVEGVARDGASSSAGSPAAGATAGDGRAESSTATSVTATTSTTTTSDSPSSSSSSSSSGGFKWPERVGRIMWGAGSSSGGGTGAVASPPSRSGTLPRATKTSVQDYLPDDYEPDLLPEDILPELQPPPPSYWNRQGRRQPLSEEEAEYERDARRAATAAAFSRQIRGGDGRAGSSSGSSGSGSMEDGWTARPERVGGSEDDRGDVASPPSSPSTSPDRRAQWSPPRQTRQEREAAMDRARQRRRDEVRATQATTSGSRDGGALPVLAPRPSVLGSREGGSPSSGEG